MVCDSRAGAKSNAARVDLWPTDSSIRDVALSDSASNEPRPALTYLPPAGFLKRRLGNERGSRARSA